MNRVKLLVLAASVAAMVRCSDSPGNPLEPGSASDGASSNAAADGSTLKASVPVLLTPKDNVRVDTRRPTLTFENSRGQYQSAAYTYRLELYEVNNLISTVLLQQAGGGQTSHTVPTDLNYNTTYRWRVRAELDGAFTAYAATVDFLSPEPPPPPPAAAAPIPAAPTTGGGGGTVGGNRNIGLSEAFNMIVSYHNSSGANLGSSSSRESRVAFLWAAVAIIHYGHPRYNPAGGDPNWCVKDAGGGRPPSDDVLVYCSTREAWDLIGSAGANGYSFHLDGIGRLGGEQNVYPPPRSSLP